MYSKLYESEGQILYRGLDDKLISIMEDEIQKEDKLFCIYAEAENLLAYINKGYEFPKSAYLYLHTCIDAMTDEFIINLHKKLEEDWQPMIIGII